MNKLRRYARQIILPEIGSEGQSRLFSAKVVVVGAGGLGSPVLYSLASAGVGHIKIIDLDIVDITNLNRQFIHFENDIGREKSQSAKDKLEQYNHDIQIDAITVMLDEKNTHELLTGYDAVMSCVDNKKTRYLLNNTCIKNNIFFIDGGIQGFDGYLLTVLPNVTSCYECIFPQKEQVQESGGGVLGVATGVIGSMMAMEAIKYIAGIPITSYFNYVDLLSWRITPINVEKNFDCPVCGAKI